MHLDKGPQPVKFSCTILDRFGTWLVARTEEFREVVHLGGLDRMDSVQALQLREGGGRWAALQHGNAHNKSAITLTYNYIQRAQYLICTLFQSVMLMSIAYDCTSPYGIHEVNECYTKVHPDPREPTPPND
jgi:hypothetical protein